MRHSGLVCRRSSSRCRCCSSCFSLAGLTFPFVVVVLAFAAVVVVALLRLAVVVVVLVVLLVVVLPLLSFTFVVIPRRAVVVVVALVVVVAGVSFALSFLLSFAFALLDVVDFLDGRDVGILWNPH